jgi:hypothetical protein
MKILFPVLIVGAAFLFVARGTPGLGHLASQLGSSFESRTSTVGAGERGATYYAPNEDLEAIDSNQIEQSRCDHLNIAMYSFTDWKLAEAVIGFANRGHLVRIYRDREQYQEEMKRNSRVIAMFQGNRNIQIRVKASMVLMHIKSWSDGCSWRDGSANWSPSGEKQQDNSLTLTIDPKAVSNFETKFNEIWNRSDNFVVQ